MRDTPNEWQPIGTAPEWPGQVLWLRKPYRDGWRVWLGQPVPHCGATEWKPVDEKIGP